MDYSEDNRPITSGIVDSISAYALIAKSILRVNGPKLAVFKPPQQKK